MTHLLIQLCTVVVTLLPGPGDGTAYPGRVPGTNAGHLAQAFVGLPWQLLGMPATSDPCRWERLEAKRPLGSLLNSLAWSHRLQQDLPTFNTSALRDSNDINDLALAEHTVYRHLLLQPSLSPGHLLSHSTTIQLDLHDVGLLLPKGQ